MKVPRQSFTTIVSMLVFQITSFLNYRVKHIEIKHYFSKTMFKGVTIRLLYKYLLFNQNL